MADFVEAEGRLMIGTAHDEERGLRAILTFESNDLGHTIEIDVPQNVVRAVAAKIEAMADSITAQDGQP
jgi:hypothetical protein